MMLYLVTHTHTHARTHAMRFLVFLIQGTLKKIENLFLQHYKGFSLRNQKFLSVSSGNQNTESITITCIVWHLEYLMHFSICMFRTKDL